MKNGIFCRYDGRLMHVMYHFLYDFSPSSFPFYDENPSAFMN